MSELLPIVQAANVQASITDFLTTTFALSDPDVRDSLDGFLSSPETGMFKGPYVRARLPFQPAAPGWETSLQWRPPRRPYGHQAAAYGRLASQKDGDDRRPLPTLVVTGTGSGKTEAFLHPILDHVRRARQRGEAGLKALLLYPMNALANDQAGRLTRLITEDAALRGVTAGIYTGEQAGKRSVMSSKGLINDREVMRDSPPDILLTNYKMLDQLLLRAADAGIWKASALSLQYLVLDEFHTYDGAQGTDVAMLLRRLGLVLKSHWPDDAAVTPEDHARPLGLVTPVATSATLGDKGDPSAMRSFAQDVFGEVFDDDAVITETRLSMPEWTDGAAEEVAASGMRPVPTDQINTTAMRSAVDDLGHDPEGRDLAVVVLSHLYASTAAALETMSPSGLLSLTRAHPLVQQIAEESSEAISLADLAERLHPGADSPRSSSTGEAERLGLVADLVAMLGHVRSVTGREALSVDVHLWVRELTRVDRATQSLPEFRWGDDGAVVALSSTEAARPSFPAIYCRHCGRSGWMVAMSPTGLSLAASDETIRADHAAGKGRTLALLHAPREGQAAVDTGQVEQGLRWLSVQTRDLRAEVPGEGDPDLLEGWLLPVLTVIGQTGQHGSGTPPRDTCPSCTQEDGIRFLGSAIATLLSVSLSTLFGSGSIDAREKKALVFTDSVQDAAHRAGFVQARSHTLTFRAAVYDAVRDGEVGLDELPARMLQLAGDDPFARYRLLHPELADLDTFRTFWQSRTVLSTPKAVRDRVRRRLACDLALEAGLASRVGRTLERTGAVAIGVEAGPPQRMASAARAVLSGFAVQADLHETSADHRDDDALVAWVHGVLERMRVRGAIDHEWFDTYRKRDGKRYPIWGGRPKGQGAPAFPPGRQAPAYPRVGGSPAPKDSGLDPVTSPQSWYSQWAVRALGVTAADGGSLTRLLLARLVADGVLRDTTSDSGATVYSLPASAVVLVPTTEADLAAGRHLLVCDVCQAQQPGTATAVDQLAGRPCPSTRCGGLLRREPVRMSFYRRLYASPDMRRVVAREHTSLLDAKERVGYENAFKAADPLPSDPNVLVATPTLEMGIDIGDLSTVFLSSLPKTVASYLQRVGRAGRLTGNALNLAYVTGRGDQLPRLGDPLSVINGKVRPPATYLNAEEILRRQLTAHLADTLATDPSTPVPTSATQVMSNAEPGTYLGELVAAAEADPEGTTYRFCATFASAAAPLPEGVVEELVTWMTPADAPRTSRFAALVARASGQWQKSVEELEHRAGTIDERLPGLEAQADSPAATDDDKRSLRSARTALKVIQHQLGDLRGEHWVAVLEEHGVFPNYTLLDDGVTLDVGVTWVNPDTDQFESTPYGFRRAAGQAIREFAPGATFYASGLEIPIDAVDLGVDGQDVRPWVHCPDCGYATDIEATGTVVVPTSCPRCGTTAIADAGQHLPVLELRKVTAEVRRDDASISDRSDERARKRFQIVVSADIREEDVLRRWYADGIGLGCTLLRSVDVRWTNLGLPASGGQWTIAGRQLQAGLFRVCEGCGKLDSDAGSNKPHEHRPWCRYRTAAEEHTTSLALSRTLTTQGLLLRLPRQVTVGDQFAVPSVAAALLLGLREKIGGHPDHLAVQQVVEPEPSSGERSGWTGGTHEALLLHDIVPGGTGYLTELADPVALRAVLAAALKVLEDCECRGEERLACHRCLLPFVLGSQVGSVSRATAERHLRTLLGMGPQETDPFASAWTAVETPPPTSLTGDSHLEQRFFALARARFGPESGASTSVTEIPGPKGNTLQFTDSASRRVWSLTPQVHLGHCVPDFVLSCNDANVPDTAVFVDGWAFHASPAHRDRLADDAEKREVLRQQGRSVIAVTAADLDAAETGVFAPPSWFSERARSAAIGNQQMQASPAAYDLLASGVLDQLTSWFTTPHPDHRARVARSIPLFLMTHGATPSQQLAGRPLDAVAAELLTGSPGEAASGDDDGIDAPPGRRVFTWRAGAVAAAFAPVPAGSFELALVLDDRAEVVERDSSHRDAWREWLRLSNALSLRDWATTITTVSRMLSASATPAAPSVPSAPMEPLTPAWQRAYEATQEGAERSLVLALASVAGLPAPEVGVEGPDGIPINLCFRGVQVAVLLEADANDAHDLSDAGWRVVGPEADEIVAAVLAGGPVHRAER